MHDSEVAGARHQLDSIFQGLPALLTARDLEAILQIDVKTIYGYVQRGLIPYVRIQSNVRFPKYQILEWIKRQNFQPQMTGGKVGG